MRVEELKNTVIYDIWHLFYLSFTISRDLAVIVASMAYNTWFTKLYCKDLRIVSINVRGSICCKNRREILRICFLLKGVRGHRTGPAHRQQIVQPGGDHSGERRAKIVSFEPSCNSLYFHKK